MSRSCCPLAAALATLAVLTGTAPALATTTAPQLLKGRVVAVADGDTLTLFDSNHLQHKVRLAGGGPWQIPLSFWKIAVLQKTANKIAAAAFIVGQTEYVQALYEAKVFSGLKPYTIDEMRSRKIQTTIAEVEREAGLDFGALKQVDAHGSLESTRQTRWFNRLEDILI